MTRRIGLLCGVTGALLLGATASASAGTLDQQQPSSNTNAGLFTNQSVAQTFTPGMSGGVDRVDLSFLKVGTPPASVTVEIRNTSAGKPGTSVLGTTSVPTSLFGPTLAFVPATFATPAPVTAGTQYAIVTYSPGAGGNAVGSGYQGAGNPYAPGAMFVSNTSLPPGDPWNEQMGSDLAFITYVAPAPPTTTGSPTTPTVVKKKKCKKKKHKRSAESAKKKKCKKKKHS